MLLLKWPGAVRDCRGACGDCVAQEASTGGTGAPAGEAGNPESKKRIQFGCPRSSLLASVRCMVDAVLLIYHGTVPDMTRKFFS